MHGNLFPFLRGHAGGIRTDAYAPKVKAVGVKAGVNRGIPRAVGGSVKTAGLLQHRKLLVAQVFQIVVAQCRYPCCCTRPVLVVKSVVLSAAVVKIGEQTDYQRIDSVSKQLTPVCINAVPVADSVSRTKGPAGAYKISYLPHKFFVLFHLL